MHQEEPIQVVQRAAGPQCRDKDMTSSDIWIPQHRPVCWFAATEKRERGGWGWGGGGREAEPISSFTPPTVACSRRAHPSPRCCNTEALRRRKGGGRSGRRSGAAASTQFPSRETVLISYYG